MGDLESLLLVITAIYLTECAAWVRRSSVAVRQGWNAQWHLRHPGVVCGNAHGAIVMANPLPPLGTVLLGHPFPVSLSPQGMLSFTAVCLDAGGRPPQLARWLRYADAQSIGTEGRTVFVNGTLFVKAPSPMVARRLAGLLRELKALPENDRGAAIRRALATTLDADAARKRWEDFQKISPRLRWLGNLLFIYLFVLAPTAIWFFGFRLAGLWVVAGLLAQTFTIGWQFWRAHGALYPSGSEERFAPFLTMLLAPPTAIRAYDLLARRLVESFHPLALTEAFCGGTAFQQLARRVLLDLRFPMLPSAPSSEPAIVQTEEWFRGVFLEECERAAERAGLKPSELIRPPVQSEKASRSYCPRCGAQFVVQGGVCVDCGGRALTIFS